MEVSFKINGKQYKVCSKDVPIDTSLNTYIRTHAQLTGTKFMCLEGGCGICMVTVKRIHPITEEQQIFSVNSCLKSLYSCDGLEIITIEGVGSKKDGYHPIQKRLYELNGTQCGFCSPGMVMSMYSLMEGSAKLPNMQEIERSLGGNICRCTGYRPILDAFKSFASDADRKLIAPPCRDTDLEDMDIEDLSRSCPKKGQACAGLCFKPIERPLHFEFVGDKHWYKAVDIKGIFDILDKSGATPYMLVGGNTAQGITRIADDVKIFIDISTIPELYQTDLTNDELIIGGSNSLKDTMDLLRETSSNPGFEYCLDLANHIQLIACDSVRNLGTIAGNLCFKNLHNEFPSDIFVIMTTVNARMTILGTKNARQQIAVDDFLAYKMNKKVLFNVILPKKVTPPIFKTYKIMNRAQNAHAYVNAGFSLDVQGEQIVSARICYGGINPSFVRANKTEKYLVGNNLYTNDILREALKSLASELIPDSKLTEASPEYRKNLALALFYKFVLSTAPPNKVTPINLSGGLTIERPLSSGTQTYQTIEKNYPLTKPVQKLEGLIQCSGEAQYINDIPPFKDELWAEFVLATKVHSKIGEIDTTEALKIPGVRYFFSAKDIPGKNDFTPVEDFSSFVEELFVGVTSEVLFYGQPLGVILADTMSLAMYAASKVKVIYVDTVPEETSSTFSMARSLLSPLLGPDGTANMKIIPTIKEAFEYDAQDRFNESPTGKVATKHGLNTTQTIEGRFQVGNQFHFSMENQTTICVPADNGMDVYSSTQWVTYTQMAIASCLGIQENELNMVVKRIGGSYGSKISRSTQVACACALACFLTNRPIRFIMNLEANMKVMGKRYGLISDYTVDIDDMGTIQKISNYISQDYGCSLNDPVQELTMPLFANCYLSDTFSLQYSAVLTDSASNTFCRGPGSLEGIAMIENIMEHIATVTGLDPIDVRLSNMAKDHPLRAIYADFERDIEYRKRQADCEAFNKINRWRKRGIALTFMQWPSFVFYAFQAYVAIYHRDGTVVISHAGVETGQGINTKVAQVAAYALGVPLEFIKIKPHNNVISANSYMTAASCASEMVAYATKRACEMLVERMKPIRDAMPADTEWPVLTEACHKQFLDLRATYQFKSSDEAQYNIYGMTCSETEVDILTGNYQLKRVDILEDVGESMSPFVDVGQVEGAFIMGIGYWFTEQLIYCRESGDLLTDRTWNYKPPGANDIPVDFRITFLKNSPNPSAGVLRSKSVGEPAICMAISAMFALRNAVASSRRDSGLLNTWFTFGSATTPEEVFLKTGNSIETFSL